MAGTTASEIDDLFMTRISDYRLDTIYTTSGSAAFTTYLEPWLLDAIVEFTPTCNQSLDYTESNSGTEGGFSETLTLENRIILSKLMLLSWLGKTIKDIIQMQVFLQDHDYKTHSAAQNLVAKQQLYNTTREELFQMLNDYAYRNNDWSNWNLQNFV